MTDSSRPSLPPPSDADSSSGPSSAAPTSLDAAQSDIPEPFREAVSALREQTQTAAETIRALRAENQRLRDKVEELSQRPDVGDDDAFAHFDNDREALRQRIQHFIDAIDDHLDTAPESGVASGNIEPLASDQSTEESPEADADTRAADDSPENDQREERLYAEDSPEEVQYEKFQPEDVQPGDAQPGEDPMVATPSESCSAKSSASEKSSAAESCSVAGSQEGDVQHRADPLADGLPDAAQFEVEVPDEMEVLPADASADDSSESRDESAESSDSASSDEPLLIAPGLSPRRSARRSARRGRRR